MVHLRRNPDRVPHRRPRRAGANPAGASPRETGTIRSWARARGYDVPPRGRIPLEVREAWERRGPKG
ncbi:Lsr2 family protein [Streptomyces sp. NE06-03E]|nr:histone-like nucleoid-structuring protein Lsr2 [Streptomyces sp. NE06-03E]MDX3055278.1 Lsr2 family protein [Streptomyces sp. NE06-03E]